MMLKLMITSSETGNDDKASRQQVFMVPVSSTMLLVLVLELAEMTGTQMVVDAKASDVFASKALSFAAELSNK